MSDPSQVSRTEYESRHLELIASLKTLADSNRESNKILTDSIAALAVATGHNQSDISELKGWVKGAVTMGTLMGAVVGVIVTIITYFPHH